MTEIRKASVRIVSNYTRLLLNLAMSLALVPLLLQGVGAEGLGLINLIVGTVGFALVLDEIVQNSLIRELGTALHRDGGAKFRETFSSAMVASAAAAAFSIVVFALLLLVLPLLTIPADLTWAARHLVLAKGAETLVVVLFAPHFNLFLVTERMAQANAWLVARRSSLVVAAVVVAFARPADPGVGVALYGWLAAGLHTAVVLASVGVTFAVDRRASLVPFRPALGELRIIARNGGWSALYFGTQLLTLQPLGVVIVNKSSGLYGVLVLTVAAQAAGYVRMATSGLADGIEAVAARLSSTGNAMHQRGALSRLVAESGRLQAMVAAPAAVGMFVLCTPFLQVWVGARLDDPRTVADMATIARILTVYAFAMALADNWTSILYGAGRLRSYAPGLSVFHVTVPLAAVTLLFFLPDDAKLLAVPVSLACLSAVFLIGWVPAVVARSFAMTVREVFVPVLRPMAVAVGCAPILLLTEAWVESPSVVSLGLSAATYAASYVLASWFFTLTVADRARLQAVGGAFLPNRDRL